MSLCAECGEPAVLYPCRGDVADFYACSKWLCGDCLPYCPDCDEALS